MKLLVQQYFCVSRLKWCDGKWQMSINEEKNRSCTCCCVLLGFMASGACACGVPTTAAAPTGGKEGEGVDMRRLLMFQLCKKRWATGASTRCSCLCFEGTDRLG
jgi:hypothetical protein